LSILKGDDENFDLESEEEVIGDDMINALMQQVDGADVRRAAATRGRT
jgi:hypothetical protein